MTTITYKQLKSKKACPIQLALFKEKFGEEVTITVELAESVASLFKFGWAARHLLSPAAFAEYEKVYDSAYAEYLKVRDSAYAEYKKVHESAYAEYLKVRESAYAEYEKVIARTFAQLYIKE